MNENNNEYFNILGSLFYLLFSIKKLFQYGIRITAT